MVTKLIRSTISHATTDFIEDVYLYANIKTKGQMFHLVTEAIVFIVQQGSWTTLLVHNADKRAGSYWSKNPMAIK